MTSSTIPQEMIERGAKIKAELLDLEFRYGRGFLENKLHDVCLRYRQLKADESRFAPTASQE